MKKIIYLFVAVMIFGACDKAPEGMFVVKGKIANFTGKKATLKKSMGRRFIDVATADVVDGKFQFKDSIFTPDVYVVTFDSTKKSAMIFMEPTIVNVEIDAEGDVEAKVSGGKLQKDLNSFTATAKDIDAEIKVLTDKYMEARKANDVDKIKTLTDEYYVLADKRKEKVLTFVKANNSSLVSGLLVSQLAQGLKYDDLKMLSETLSKEVLDSKYASFVTEKLQVEERTAPGKIAPEIKLMDANGKEFDVASLKGKYVLVDFWASWCGPCRKLIPELKTLYAELEGKNFEIVGVSVDRKEDDWRKALNEEKLGWVNVHQKNNDKTSPSAVYGVTGIPHTVIIDPEGKIVATKLHGDQLTAKIKELLN